MTGDSHTNDDSDFLEDDFVVEDIVGKNDDLEDLFEAPASSKADSEGKTKGTQDGENPAEDDLLFADHTEGLEPTEEFVKPSFAEDAPCEWQGAELDLESVGVPDSSLRGEEAAADPEIAEAAQSFVQELDSLLNEEEDFGIESEADLELVEMDAVQEDGVSEFEQSGPFVLDDGDGLWSDDLEESASDEAVVLDDASSPAPTSEELEPAAAELEEPEMTLMSAGDQLVADSFGEGEPSEEFEDVDNLQLLDTAAAGADGAGWEPLPARSMDGLSEVDEVQRTDDDYDTEGYEDDEYEDESYEDGDYEGAAVDGDLEDVDGHDIYGEDEDSDRAVVLGGPGSQRSRTKALLLSMAASILFLVGVSTIVVRPEWFGLSVEPEQVARIDLARPKIEVAVVEPRIVPLANAQPETSGAEGAGAQNIAQPVGGAPDGVEPNNPAGGTGAPNGTGSNGATANGADTNGPPDGTTPNVSNPNTGSQATPTAVEPTPPVNVMANGGDKPELPTLPEQPVVATPEVQPIAVTPTPNQNTGPTAPGTVGNSWPIATAKPVVKPAGDKPALTPFGDGLMVGGTMGMTPVRALEGVMPGSRAFAQLHNGNYFIGKVKQVADETITLRLETGEITLATGDIAQITRLGSTDYDELQKATKGFVRLTNNNRLIGGILSQIADDHIILEFRSNRVMLPKSAIGEIVSGKEEDTNVRLGTTNEEDNWVRLLAERQLGTGQGVAPKNNPKAPASSEPPR